MSQEIEAKYRVEDQHAVDERLRALGAEGGQIVLETDQLLDRPDGSLRQADCVVRLRLREEPGGADECLLTWKGPRQGGGSVKSRREIETTVGDCDAAGEILQAAGLHVARVIQKCRSRWRLDGCAIELDELPLIGCFVEIEGQSEQAVADMAARLELPGPPICDSYAALLEEACRKLGRDFESVTFD
jgi:adenylate cyclase class 2